MANAADETKAVSATVQKYLDGVAQDNADLVVEAFHPDATMSGHFNGDFAIIPNAGQFIAEYMKSAPPIAESSPNLASRIESIEQTGTMAQVSVAENGLEGMNFTTLFHLHKDNSNWLITAKATYAQEPA